MATIEYTCSGCGVSGVKLWREFDIFAVHVKLHCVDCACKVTGKDAALVDKDGRRPCDFRGEFGVRTDQIGSLVPAVPTVDADTFWGYASVPDDRVGWWRRLPLRRSADEGKRIVTQGPDDPPWTFEMHPDGGYTIRDGTGTVRGSFVGPIDAATRHTTTLRDYVEAAAEVDRLKALVAGQAVVDSEERKT